jgi:hypothetical protein
MINRGKGRYEGTSGYAVSFESRGVAGAMAVDPPSFLNNPGGFYLCPRI